MQLDRKAQSSNWLNCHIWSKGCLDIQFEDSPIQITEQCQLYFAHYYFTTNEDTLSFTDLQINKTDVKNVQPNYDMQF